MPKFISKFLLVLSRRFLLVVGGSRRPGHGRRRRGDCSGEGRDAHAKIRRSVEAEIAGKRRRQITSSAHSLHSRAG